MDNWKRIDCPDVNPHLHCQLIFDKSTNGEREVFPTTSARRTGYPYEKNKILSLTSNYTQKFEKGHTHLSVRAKLSKLPKYRISLQLRCR